MMYDLRLLSVASVLLGFVLLGRAADPANTDVEKMQGKWRVALVYDDNGEKVPQDELKRMSVQVRGNCLIISQASEKDMEFDFSVDETRPLKRIDLTNREDKKTGLGIYRIEKDTWTLCVASPDNPRPESLEARGKSILSMTLRRN